MADKKVNIDKLIDSYMELASADPDLLKDMLREQGYDPSELEKRGIQKIKKLIFTNQVALKKAKLINLYNKATHMMNVASSDTREAILALLKRKSPNLQFRNLEKLDEENLRQILNETEVLELIDKLEKGQLP
jgi:hypothetical protein